MVRSTRSSSRSSATGSFRSARSSSPGIEASGRTTVQPNSHRSGAEEQENNSTAPRFEPAEEATHVSTSNATKKTGNDHFAHAAFPEAILTYNRALAECPSYLEYEMAVLQSNIAACHIKLKEWKDAVENATKAIDGLARVDPSKDKRPEKDTREERKTKGAGWEPVKDEDTEDEQQGAIVVEVDDEMEKKLEDLSRNGHTLSDVKKLRVKALMRRAKARGELGGWADLSGAQEDYKMLVGDLREHVSEMDMRNARDEARKLGPRVEKAKNDEMAEMMGKLKDLGNGLLKPFGLNTNMFNFVKDEKTGGYSMNFDQSSKG